MSEPQQSPTPSSEPSRWLQHQCVVAGLVSSASRFVPLPFVDDLVRMQCQRFVVSRALASRDRSEWARHFRPVYGGGGCLAGCIRSLIRAPLKLLLFPIRKVLVLVTSVRHVPLEIMRMVLLGRTLDRYLAEQAVPPSGDEVVRMRVAFEESFARMDFHVLRAAMLDALSSVGGLKAAAIASARRLATRSPVAAGELPSDEALEAGATKVQAVLQRSETLELSAEFDRRYNETLQRLTLEKEATGGPAS